MNKRRLLTLATFLEKLPPKRFDFAHFVSDDWKGKQDLSCGATACAIGWCPSIPAFKKLKLQIRKVDNEPAIVFAGQRVTKNAYAQNLSGKTAQKIFDLSIDEVSFLFFPRWGAFEPKPESTATPKQVARHIRKFVERGGLPESMRGADDD